MAVNITDTTFLIIVTVTPLFVLLILLFTFRRLFVFRKRRAHLLSHLLISKRDFRVIEKKILVWPDHIPPLVNEEQRDTANVSSWNLSERGKPRLENSTTQYALFDGDTPKKMIILQFVLKRKALECGVAYEKIAYKQVDFEKNKTLKFKKSKDRRHYISLMSMGHAAILKLQHLCIQDNVLWACYEGTGRGNLQDVLSARRFKFNLAIKYGFYYDLVSGLDYIHRKTGIRFHGGLCPKNCMVDDNWVLKIAGFGHHAYVQNVNIPERGDTYDSRFFLAPEILFPNQDNSTMSVDALQRADIYSLGMLICTVFSEQLPFEWETDAECIALLNKLPMDIKNSVRPAINKFVRLEIKETIRHCWTLEPLARPVTRTLLKDIALIPPFSTYSSSSFSRLAYASQCCSLYATELEEFIRKVEIAHSNEIPDFSNQYTRIEDHHALFSANEVALTREQPSQIIQNQDRSTLKEELDQIKKNAAEEVLEIEKQMIDLKYAMLPKPFMKMIHDNSTKRLTFDKLLMKAGANIVDLERNIRMYGQVSIMVVSIAEFEKLVEKLSHNPHLLLELLNRFYHILETISESVDNVFIIDKMGERCVFVCGAPEPTKNHCEQILKVAIKFKDWSSKWDASWLLGGAQYSYVIGLITGYDEKLKLKIGVHSGPVLGGIIGSIPKFLLVGATFDIADGIQKSSEGGQIRISSISQSYISGNIDFIFENTGQIDLEERGGKVWTFSVESSEV